MLSVRFEGLEEAKQVYDPILVERAAGSTIKQLHNKAATLVSREVRKKYSIKVRDITATLKKRIVYRDGVPSGFLVYTSKRTSLSRFTSYKGVGVPAQHARPKVRSRRGLRRGARVRVVRSRPAKVVDGAFWGKGRAGLADGAGEWQIFRRIGLGRLPVKKLTGPAIAQMVRGDDVLEAINDLMDGEADALLSKNLDHFILRKAGIR